jgi:peptidoglycan hydrolase-like protein with peptidoglycan-binding domain
MAKLVSVATGIAMAASMLSLAPMAHAAGCDVGTANLAVGSTGASVRVSPDYARHRWILSLVPAGVAMGTFGPLTKAAVAKWQTAVGVSPRPATLVLSLAQPSLASRQVAYQPSLVVQQVRSLAQQLVRLLHDYNDSRPWLYSRCAL